METCGESIGWGKVWGNAQRLPAELNNSTAIYSPSVARDGDLYFNQSDLVTKRERLSWSQWIDGHYTSPRPVSFDDKGTVNFTAAVAPDESFIIFSGHRASTPDHQAVVFVAFAKNHEWGRPVPFKPFLYGEQERLSPDLKTLYFVSDRPLSGASPNKTPDTVVPWRIWQISLEDWAVLGYR